MEIAANLETQRLLLVPMQFADVVFFWRLLGNAKVRKFLGGPVHWRRRVGQFRQFRRGHPKVGIWIVRSKASQSAIGIVVLNPHKDGADYEVSYEFQPSSWGQGFAGEATACIVDHGIADLGLRRVIAETQSANSASCRMLRRIGFHEERRFERYGAEQVIFARTLHPDRSQPAIDLG